MISILVDYLTVTLIDHIIFFQLVLLLILLSNIWITHRIRRYSPTEKFPVVSILIPVRNEESCIAGCVQSYLGQDYPSFEVIVLDDQSNDASRAILETIALSEPNLRIILGVQPTHGQVGKNWACSQLSHQAQGELLFFTDADTVARPDTLKTVVTALLGAQADLITGFPKQEIHTLGEKALVPFFSWAFLSFVPLLLAYQLKVPFLSVAVGQMMLFRREAYLDIGGHDGIISSVVDDISLARRINEKGLRWRVTYVADLIACRMYHSSREAVNGFTKNLFAASGYRLLPYLFTYLWLFIMFWEPLFVMALLVFCGTLKAQPYVLMICIALSYLLWLIPYLEMKIPFYLSFFYPYTVLANICVAFRSLIHTLEGRITWKGRAVDKARWKWF
ncbi:glycosyltransferase [Chloroflexota bacterium]|nr:glycosyltransferase [Chloroflexota bacterium]